MNSANSQTQRWANTNSVKQERETSPVIFLDQTSGWESPVSLRNEKIASPSNNNHLYFSEKVNNSKIVSPFSPLVKGVLKNSNNNQKQDGGYTNSTGTKSLVVSEQNTPQNINRLLNNFLSTRNSTNNGKKIDFDDISESQLTQDLIQQSGKCKIQHAKSPSSVSGSIQSAQITGYQSVGEYKKQIDILCKKIQDQSKRIEQGESQIKKLKEKENESELELKEMQTIYRKQKIIIEKQAEEEKQQNNKIEELINDLASKKNTIECLKIDHIQELQQIYEKNQQEVASLRQSMANSSLQDSINTKYQQPFNSTLTVKSQIIDESPQPIKNTNQTEVQELLQKLQTIDLNTANLVTYERQEKIYLHQRIKELNLRIMEIEQQLQEKEEWCTQQINRETEKIYKFFEKESSKQDTHFNEQRGVIKMTYEEQIKQMQLLLQNQKSRNKEIAIELKQQFQENDKLISSLEVAESQNQQLSQVNQVLKNQNIEFSTIIASQKERIRTDIDEIAALKNNVLNKSNEMKMLIPKNASLEGQIKELTLCRQEQLELTLNYVQLKAEHDTLKSTFQEQNTIFLELQQDNKIIQDQLNHFRSNHVGDQIEQFKRECSEDELKLKIQHLENVIKEKETYIQEILEIQNQGSKDFDKKSTGFLSQQKELLQQQENLKQQNFQLIGELERSKTQYKNLENQHLETLTTQREEINNLYIQLQKQQLEQKGEDQDLQRRQDDILAVKSKYNKLKRKYNNIEVEKERLEFVIEELKLDNQRGDILQEQNNHYRQQAEELLKKVEYQSITLLVIIFSFFYQLYSFYILNSLLQTYIQKQQKQQTIFSLEQALSQVETL